MDIKIYKNRSSSHKNANSLEIVCLSAALARNNNMRKGLRNEANSGLLERFSLFRAPQDSWRAGALGFLSMRGLPDVEGRSGSPQDAYRAGADAGSERLQE
jgi:hypothetical protein